LKLIISFLLLITLTTTQAAQIKVMSYKQELKCLTAAIFYEANIESEYGKIAVAHVIKNRTKSKYHPSGICNVILEPGQFQWTKKKEIEYVAEVSKLAHGVLVGKIPDNTKGSTHFHRKDLKPGWKNLERTVSIGNHEFYRYPS
jgi:spore germination cell wall hydrolase CwlJ-like protein